jgi:hypothetical protein
MSLAILEDVMHDREYLADVAWIDRELTKLTERAVKAEQQRDELLQAGKDALSSLVAAVSLLERGGKKAAASDKMFVQMLVDYNNSINRSRAAIAKIESEK